jgi:murein DD-endopeptidase MepM/ murein hydrolase activator NlpD
MARGKSSRIFYRLLIVAALIAIVFLGLFTFRIGPPPTIEIGAGLPGIGKRTPIDVVVEEPRRGLSDIRVEFVQGERVELLAEREFTPLEPWELWGERTERDELNVEVGSETLKGLQPGPATVRVVAQRARTWLRRPTPATRELELEVKLRPPSLQVVSTRTYVDQGGCEAVVYRVGETAVRDGVQAGAWWFPGFPLPGGDERDRFAWFGIPFDMDDASEVRLTTEDDVGNRASARFIDRFRPRPVKTDTIRISDRFMERVVPAILDQTPGLEDQGDLLANYLMVNGELRRRNAATLMELSQRSAPRFLWQDEFLPMRNAQVMSNFADRRTYLYDGREVDQQDHLGFDLASTAMADVQAANTGIVLLAGYFGIYGNTVVLDHGFGLLSLYGHLSNIAVEEGQTVERGEVVGRSGATGLAGGDHLHFAILLHGMPVNPAEWWDGHWIHDRLELKLGDALPFTE